jgi:hypothetical protein
MLRCSRPRRSAPPSACTAHQAHAWRCRTCSVGGWLAACLLSSHSAAANTTQLKATLSYAVEIWWCVCTCTSAQQGVSEHRACSARALRRASSSAANPSVKASTYTSLNVGALAASSGTAAAEGRDSSASARLGFSSLWKCAESTRPTYASNHIPFSFLLRRRASASPCGFTLLSCSTGTASSAGAVAGAFLLFFGRCDAASACAFAGAGCASTRSVSAFCFFLAGPATLDCVSCPAGDASARLLRSARDIAARLLLSCSFSYPISSRGGGAKEKRLMHGSNLSSTAESALSEFFFSYIWFHTLDAPSKHAGPCASQSMRTGACASYT